MKMDFPRNQFSMLAIVLAAFWGLPNVAAAQESEAPIEAQILFTHGTDGHLRESDQFQFEEDPKAVIWITGLRARPQDQGRITLRGRLRSRAPNGEVLSDVSVQGQEYLALFGDGADAFGLQVNVDGKAFTEDPFEVLFDGVHIQTGRQFSASRKFTMKHLDQFAIVDYDIVHNGNKSYGPGMFLQTGGIYSVTLNVVNATIQDAKARFRCSLVGCDVQGRPYQNEVLTREMEEYAPIGTGQYMVNDLGVSFMPNRPGKHILRFNVEDLNSGEKASRDIPITVVSVYGDSSPAANASPPPGQLHVEGRLTYGANGLLRPSNVYYGNEKIFGQFRLTGLATDVKGYGKVSLRSVLTAPDGTVLGNETMPPFDYRDLLGGGAMEVSLWQTTSFAPDVSGTATWTLEFTDQNTGAKGTYSQPIEVNPDRQFRTTGYQFFRGENSDIPAGRVFQVGNLYRLNAQVIQPQAKNSSLEVEAKLFGIDRQGNRLSVGELVVSKRIEFSRYGTPAESLSVNQPFRVNRSGEYALRLIVTDKHSGQVSSEDIPITVVGQGPNDPVGKPR